MPPETLIAGQVLGFERSPFDGAPGDAARLDEAVLIRNGKIAAVGKRADLAIWDVTGVESAGSWDPAALLLAGPTKVRDLFVEGRQIVRDGQMTSINLSEVLLRQNQLAKAFAEAT